MKSFISGCIIALVIAVGAMFILNGYQQASLVAYSSPTGVRL